MVGFSPFIADIAVSHHRGIVNGPGPRRRAPLAVWSGDACEHRPGRQSALRSGGTLHVPLCTSGLGW
jgi:hypothetical protein